MAWLSDNVTEVAIVGRWTNSRDFVTVVHVRREEDDPAESARDVLNNWQDHLVGGFVNNYVLQGCRYTDHNEAVGATGFIVPDPTKPITGGDAGTSTPPGIAILAKKLIDAHVGRRAGRMYLPPPPEVNVDENGILAPAVLTSTNSQLGDFHAGLSGAGGNRLVVVHKQLVGDSPSSNVTGFVTDSLMATQRRRMRR